MLFRGEGGCRCVGLGGIGLRHRAAPQCSSAAASGAAAAAVARTVQYSETMQWRPPLVQAASIYAASWHHPANPL